MTARRKLHWSKLDWKIGLLLLVIAIILGALYIPDFISSQYPSLKQDTLVDQKVTSMITRSKYPNSVMIKIYGMGKRYRQLTYQFKYTKDDKEYVIDMVATPIDLVGKDDLTFEVPVQACTDVMCPASTRATKMWIGLAYTDLDGKVIMTGTP
ncbi:hypothetical protein KBC80_04265 [Candidatus Woesebacteria bacterium]|nr:hypothetical protein [Candidatus Woesebacteria bacterium]